MILSPCIGVCSTATGAPVCAGCKRTDVEVRTWAAIPDEERKKIWTRLLAEQPTELQLKRAKRCGVLK